MNQTQSGMLNIITAWLCVCGKSWNGMPKTLFMIPTSGMFKINGTSWIKTQKSAQIFPSHCKLIPEKLKRNTSGVSIRVQRNWIVSLGNPFQKFQQKRTIPQPSKHWRIHYPYLSSLANLHRTLVCGRRPCPSKYCTFGILSLRGARCGSHQAPPLVVLQLAHRVPVTPRALHGTPQVLLCSSESGWMSGESSILPESGLSRNPSPSWVHLRASSLSFSYLK